MAKQIQTDKISNKSLLLGRGQKRLAVFIGILLLSESVLAAPRQLSPLVQRESLRIAQQSASRGEEETKAAAERVFAEGDQLYKQRTAESLRQAIKKFEEALSLYRTVGNKAGEAVTLLVIGTVYSALGEKQKALEYYNQSLPLMPAVGDKKVEVVIFNNLGSVYDDLGEKYKALEYYNKSLSLSRVLGNKALEAFTLTNMGKVYSNLGEKQKALEYYNQSLPLFRQVGDRAGESLTLNNIGKVYSDLGEKQKALDYFNQSLLLYRQVAHKAGEAATLTNIGGVYSDLGEKQKALDYYNQSLLLSQQVGNKALEATTLNNIGGVYSDLGEKQKALDYYNQSLPLRLQVGDKAGEATTLYNFAILERDKGNLNEALTKIEAAIKIIEELRLKIGSQQLRASYFATVQNYYELYIDLLMQLHKTNPSQGYDAKALHASERSKARSLLELLTEANANIRQGVDPKLLEQERNLQQQLNAAEQNRVKLLQGQYTDKQLDNLKQQIENLITQLQQVEGEIRVKSPQYAALKYPQPLTLPEIQQQVLDDNTILLEYSLGENRSYLWLVSKTEITSYELPKRADIEAAAQAFYAQVKSSEIGSPEVGMKLSQMVLAPVANQLANKRLIIVGDGVLQTIPFAALPIPVSATSPTPLIVQNEIVTLPSVSTIAISRNQLKNRTPAPKTLAVIADPVFNINDERLQKSSFGQSNSRDSTALKRSLIDVGVTLQRLPFTRREAEAILTLVPENLRTSAFDFSASRLTATNPNLAQYRIVHFATHGLINSINPELSGVVLSLVNDKGVDEDGFLRLNDIFNLNLPAELVVLSACQTGLGKEMKGEGLVGLTRGFMYAGAKGVVVSLWSVQDAGTSELMKKFYHQMLEKKLTPVAAMRAAQLEMIQSEQWKSPYYWAAFVVQGEWN
ncbi:CHAT domain-containing protein [Floridanema aerugineum]|uniref:CHAT domain-containing protein n=1 Tax=Floridaenema aerugineum BLCC-F46 TaxID=3153654 RepID=A0ABV4XF19_9CYAN